MPSILKSGQLCNHTEKNILFGITNMISTIKYVNREWKEAAIASFDMDHAFDRAFIPYIIKVLKQMNFVTSSSDFWKTLKEISQQD